MMTDNFSYPLEQRRLITLPIVRNIMMLSSLPQRSHPIFGCDRCGSNDNNHYISANRQS